MRRCLLAVLCCLSACSSFSPNRLGYTDESWDKLSMSQKYNLQTRAHAIEVNQTRYWQRKGKVAPTSKHHEIIDVTVGPGEALVWPANETMAFQPVLIKVENGHCKSLVLHSRTTEDKTTTLVCYADGILGIDPSYTDLHLQYATLWFHRSPLWLDSLHYEPLNSRGHAKLKNSTVVVKEAAPTS